MSGIIEHVNFTSACEDVIAAIEDEMRRPECGDAEFKRLALARWMVRSLARYGRAASRLIAGDIGPETFDEEVTP